MKHIRIIPAIALALAGAASQAAVVTDDYAITVDICDFTAAPIGLLRTQAAGSNADAVKALRELPAGTCATKGAHSGVWVLKGDKEGVELGIVPSGDTSALLIQHPRYRFLTPLNVIANTIR